MVRYLTPLVSLAIMVLVVLLATFASITNVRSQAEDQLDRVINVIAAEKENEKFPTDKSRRSFVYFYAIPGHLHIDVADQSTLDWEEIHNHDRNRARFEVPEKATPRPWLDAIFFGEDSEQYGVIRTPYEANAIRFDWAAERIEKLPDFKLRFAQDPTKGLYILGHIKNLSSDPDTFVRLKLTVHYSPPEGLVSETQFIICPDEEKMGRLESCPEKKTIEGSWWEAGQDQSFELALKETQHLSALELAVQRFQLDPAGTPCPDLPYPDGLCPRFSYQIGTHQPLAKEAADGTYALTRYLNPMTLHYEVYRRDSDGMHWLSGTPERASDPAPAAVAGWLLTAVSRLYFYVSGIESCPVDGPGAPGVCFLETDGVPSRLRLGGSLPDDKEILVFTEERFVVPLWGPGLGVLAVVIPGLLGLLIYTDRARRRASARLEQANEELEQTTARLGQATEELGQANKGLEQINEALTSYVDTFLHEAARLLNTVKAEASSLAETGDDASRPGHLEKIKNLVESVKKRLWNSTEKFDYETAVRNDIARYGPARFDLIDSITDLVQGFKDYGEKQIEFQNALRDGCRPSLPAAGEQGTVDNYFTEALQAPIQNAIDYRFPQAPIIISLEMERGVCGSHAVLRVSNYGPTVPKDMLPRVFDLGSRYGGATTSQAPEPAPQDDQDDQKHQGLGLFLTRQIVRAYGGTCQMDNFHDSGGSGVKVTVRLPVRLKTGPTPSH